MAEVAFGFRLKKALVLGALRLPVEEKKEFHSQLTTHYSPLTHSTHISQLTIHNSHCLTPL